MGEGKAVVVGGITEVVIAFDSLLEGLLEWLGVAGREKELLKVGPVRLSDRENVVDADGVKEIVAEGPLGEGDTVGDNELLRVEEGVPRLLDGVKVAVGVEDGDKEADQLPEAEGEFDREGERDNVTVGGGIGE